MKHKVAELEGELLDAAVAQAMGLRYRMNGACFADPEAEDQACGDLMSTFEPSSDWSQGGPIIEREQIASFKSTDGWCAHDGCHGHEAEAETLLVAAMRYYVASKFGDEIEL